MSDELAKTIAQTSVLSYTEAVEALAFVSRTLPDHTIVSKAQLAALREALSYAMWAAEDPSTWWNDPNREEKWAKALALLEGLK